MGGQPRREAVGRRLRTARHNAWRVVVATVGACFRNRVTGLAAEAAFFALLSLPPLVFAMAGSVGYVFNRFTDNRVEDLRADVLDAALQAFTERAVSEIIEPTLDDVLSGPRFDVVSIGFVLALWSGSRALNVILDTVTIMYGLAGHRGIVRTRVLSFSLYVVALLVGVVAVPLVVAGPTLVDRALPQGVDALNALYWPVVVLVCVCSVATLYHVAVPVRTAWRINLVGAVFTLLVWVFGSFLLRWVLTVTARESTSIYGPLAAPIAVLIWLYLVTIALLIGAALNAAVDEVFPQPETTRARIELRRRLRLGQRLPQVVHHVAPLVSRRRAPDVERETVPAESEYSKVAGREGT